MQRRIIMGTVLLFLTGCAAQAMGVSRVGENARYGASNTTPREIEQVRVVDATNPDRWYFSQSGQRADTRKPGVKYVPGFGGNQLNPHKIPEEVLITWREMPPPGGQPYTGEFKGPYRVSVRSRIPDEVLRQVRRDGFSVDLSFGFDESSILFNWKLVEYKSVTGSGRGIQDWCIGGDSFKDTTKTEYQQPYSSFEPIPIWPHCKLP